MGHLGPPGGCLLGTRDARFPEERSDLPFHGFSLGVHFSTCRL